MYNVNVDKVWDEILDGLDAAGFDSIDENQMEAAVVDSSWGVDALNLGYIGREVFTSENCHKGDGVFVFVFR